MALPDLNLFIKEEVMKTSYLMKGWLVFGLCLFAIMPGLSLSQGKMRTITVATDATWPPMEMVDMNKNIVGFDIDFMNAVAKEAEFKVEYKNTAWDGIFGGLGAGNLSDQRAGPRAVDREGSWRRQQWR